MPDFEPLLSAEEAATILQVRVGTVYDWVSHGILPHVRILAGRRRAVIRFRGSEIEAFIQARSLPAASKPRRG